LVKSEIIKRLQKEHPNLKSSQVSTIIDIIFSAISDNLINQKSIELRSFGRWSVRNIKAKHNARNPKTGEIIYVPEKKKISFKMSKKLKEEINKK
jgi:Bacterial nucleoid DNA-binding protein|tara:strand:- start:248 stop:532 length:285 start_codon:yes stop_codon:yes gene_type:complete